MKHKSSFCMAILLTALFLSVNTFADARIKTRTTQSSEQTSEVTTYIKGKRERTGENFGGTPTVTITQRALRRNLEINPRSQIYLINPWQPQNDKPF